MRRRRFLQQMSASGLVVANSSSLQLFSAGKKADNLCAGREYKADVVIIGGGLGGCAAALSLLKHGYSVIMTEETDWIGGQLTQQGVPPDEHQWIETHGATQSYRSLRKAIRDFYINNYPLTAEASKSTFFNPGNGAVSRLCHEPKVALAVLQDLFLPYTSNAQLQIMLEHKVTAAETANDKVHAITLQDVRSQQERILHAPYFVDATELGDVLPLSGTEYVTGTEAKSETGELHAAAQYQPQNQQAFTMCFALDYLPGEDHIIEKPSKYDFWKNHIPKLNPPWSGKLLSLNYSSPATLEPKALGFDPRGIPTENKLNLWNYRRIIDKNNFKEGFYASDISLVNWPQNDYMLGNLIDVDKQEFDQHVAASKQLSLSLLYWLQTEAPRPDGGEGWKGLRLRTDVMSTADGMAKYPYVRESRRIKAEFTILEEHVGVDHRKLVLDKKSEVKAAKFEDSIGIGYYHIDLHPSSGGDNYIDFASLPFQIPLGALIPQRMENLIPANKNIGTTHITNGCYRLHPVEWSIGESVGQLLGFAIQKKVPPRAVRASQKLLKEFQNKIVNEGVELEWPS